MLRAFSLVGRLPLAVSGRAEGLDRLRGGLVARRAYRIFKPNSCRYPREDRWPPQDTLEFGALPGP